MYRIYTLVFFFVSVSSTLLLAQAFEFEQDRLDTTFNTSEGFPVEIKIDGHVTNLSSDTLELYWRRTIISMPREWETALCDKNTCYLPEVSERELTLDPNESLSTLDIYLYPNFFDGDSAIIQICMWEIDDQAGTTICNTYSYYNQRTSSTDNVNGSLQKASIAPNPVFDGFTLQDESNAVGRIELYNMIGARVAVFQHTQGARHDVGDLPAGVYLARLIASDSGRTLATKRLHKR